MKKTNDELTQIIGKIAAVISIGMFVAYIPQIIDNLNGNKANPIQPLVAMFNCILWVMYGMIKEKKDWPVIIANTPGIILSLLSFLTSI